MLNTLRIRNLALVADLTLELRPGFNAITGETGAGKSVILGALNLVLGQRADRGALRAGTDQCSVEAVLDVSRVRAPLARFLENNGLEPCEEGQLVLKRLFNAGGTNRQFVNGSPTTLATLATLGEWLVDLHGPHEHQSLLQPARQLALLDAFAGLDARREAFADCVRRRDALAAEKAALVVDEATYARELDLLRFQVHEIHDARLHPGEDESLAAEHRRSRNSARILELAQGALQGLSEGDDNASQQLARIGRALQELQRLDPSCAPLVASLDLATGALRDLQQSTSRYAESVDIDPERLAVVEARLDLIHGLQRKYGPGLADVVAFGQEAAKRLAALEGRDAELLRIQEATRDVEREILSAGNALSAGRRKHAPRLAEAVAGELADLGFRQSGLEVALRPAPGRDTPSTVGPTGSDECEFLFAPNPGEPARPLRAIASSGELARVMLAFKTVLAEEDDVPVLVFDEVDANVGGETAHAVGARMARIARRHQVLCITHLAAVAAHGDAHFVVTKETKGGRTESRIEPVAGDQRVLELARMLGGGTAARKHAEALLAEAAG
ncbi:MAG: DNA repair protein RecN [Verrucomicrobia bacterium]|nr:MAG: DNA repair protein RecN [Verrucomicrobiota bacterium]